MSLDRDVLSVAFSFLVDPEDLASAACVCRDWRRAAEEDFDDDVWRAVAESRGLGVVVADGGEEIEEEENEESKKKTTTEAAVAIDRRALRSNRPPLPVPGQPKSSDGLLLFTWKDRVRAAWPELCACCRGAVTGRATLSRRQGAGGGGGKEGSGGSEPWRLLVLRLCHSCSSSSKQQGDDGEPRLVDSGGALEILRGETAAATASSLSSSPSSSSSTTPPPPLLHHLHLLLSRLPRALDLPPQSPGFSAIELYRRRDVRAMALGFERDIYF